MKNKFSVSFLFVFLFVWKSVSAQPEVVTKPPGNLTGAALTEVITHIEKGKILFKKKCAKCHGVFTNGKEGVMNFSKQELKDYNINFIQQDPLNHAVSQKMTDEEMMDVIYFLQFYQRPEAGKAGNK